MQRSLLGLSLAAAVAAAPAAAGAATTPVPTAYAPLSPPSLVAPLSTATAPVLFVWTAVAPATGYRIRVQGGRHVLVSNPLVAVLYEVQISDRPDVGSHVLFDQTVDATTFLFQNDNNGPASGFTQNQPPNQPLSGGRYYWRVRALFAGPSSPYSNVQPFFLTGGGVTQSPFHDLGLTAISIGGKPIVGVTSPIVVRVSDLGKFRESGASLVFTANGEVIGQTRVPDLNAGSFIDVSVPWTPREPALAQVTAQLQYVDQNAANNTITQTLFVASQKPVVTTLAGRLIVESGGFALADRAGRPVATLLAGRGTPIDFGNAVGAQVEVTGALAAHGTGLVMTVSRLSRGVPAPAPSR
ncbi:MAG: hypothetical protein JOZ24_12335 [Candidatus Eremiobacteraeota bacterium]|nr:hypothetical protein [Candidatus Eremiobacteraeota bacterium]